MAVMLETSSLARARSEPDLIEAARDGDDRAFEELYARYHDRIGAFIRGRVRDHGRAEDIAQEVFMSALRRLRASEQAISFKPWIYEIAKNACIDEFRRSQRDPRGVARRGRGVDQRPAGTPRGRTYAARCARGQAAPRGPARCVRRSVREPPQAAGDARARGALLRGDRPPDRDVSPDGRELPVPGSAQADRGI